MKHTPGPWIVQKMEPDGFIIKRDDTYQISTPGYDVATYVPRGGPFRKLEDALLAASAPDLLTENERLRAVLEELLVSREMQHRIGLWIERFPHIKTSSIEPKSAARKRFEIWYTRATCRVIKAEEQACAALGAAEETA